ncbi:hypothetical protein JCM8547_003214 [Rhodosporidiobolus lusitaniae]
MSLADARTATPSAGEGTSGISGSALYSTNANAGPSRGTSGAGGSGAMEGAKDEGTATMLARMAGPSDLKAGVGGKRSAEEVQRIIYDASKGSRYFNDQERRDNDLAVKSKKLQALLAEAEKTVRGDEEGIVDRIIEQLEEKRDMSRVIALIDADAFYAACHQREDPSLEGTAFGVGGGMLTTASYEARKYGCRSAMPLYLAKKLCPHLVSLKLEPALYTKASKEIMTILAKYGPIGPASLDEAYVDLTQYCSDEGVTPAEAITRLRTEVRDTTGLTVSAGVSPNKALSKIAADINKPDGQFVLDFTREACMEFIRSQRLRKCYGIGRVTEVLLNAVGFTTVGDLFDRRKELYLIRNHIGNKDTFRWLLSLYLGLGSNKVVRATRGSRKTYGVESTFTPTENVDALEDRLRRIAKALSKDLGRAEFSGRTITLKIKYDNYETITRAFTPGSGIWIYKYREILEYGLRIFRREQESRRASVASGDQVKGGQKAVAKMRLLGLRVSNLRDEREVKKEAKLDVYFIKPAASPSKKRRNSGNASPSSSDDGEGDDDLIRSDAESDGDGDEENPQKRALEQLKQDALAVDPFDAIDDEYEQSGAAGGGISSGSWMRVDKEDIVQEGREAGPSKVKPKPPPPPVKRKLSSSSYTSAASSSRGPTKRSIPSLDKHDAWSSAFADSSFSYTAVSAAPSTSSASTLPASLTITQPTLPPGVDLDLTLDSPPGKKRRIKAEGSGGNGSGGGGGGRCSFTCPICDREYKGSEAAMAGHVEKCLRTFDQPKNSTSKSKKTSSSSSYGSAGGEGKKKSSATGKKR